MNNYSVQYAANIAKLLGVVLTLVGVEIPEADLATFVGVAVTLFSIGVSIFDRYKKGDISLLGVKK